MIEPLELRIAPAFTFTPTLVTFTDVDGDLVTIKSSKPVLDDADFVRNPQGVADGHQLQSILLNDDGTAADGMNLTITATPQNGRGDGLVNIGYINATGRVLGTVSVDGDLGAIDAGDTAVNAFALKSLTVHSLGELRTTTGAPVGLSSDFAGSVKSITVKGNMRDAVVKITGATDMVNSSLGTLTVGGSVLGGAISAKGNIGPVKIAGSVVGSSADGTGLIESLDGSIGALTIGGNLEGSAADFTGYIFAETSIGAISIGGDLRGGRGPGSEAGSITTEKGGIASVKIGGSIIGGAAGYCGAITAGTDPAAFTKIGAITIGGSLVGGAGGNSGFLSASGGIGTVKIGGSVVGGAGAGSGAITNASGGIAKVTIGGSLVGGGGEESGSIQAQATGAIKIAGDCRGGTGPKSGRIDVQSAASITLGGSLIGGTMDYSGNFFAADAAFIKIGGDVIGGGGLDAGSIVTSAKTVTVAGSVIGGSATFAGRVGVGRDATVVIGHDVRGGDASAANVQAAGALTGTSFKSIIIGGSMIAGRETGAGQLTLSGGIYAFTSIGSLTVKGSLVGNASANVEIFATGPRDNIDIAVPNVVLGKVTIGGSVERALISAGAFDEGTNVNPDAQIGVVKVAGDWTASDLIAGVDRNNDGMIGDGSDRKVNLPAFDSPQQFSKIASIVIGGHVLGDDTDLTRTFGFGAEEIGSFKVNGIAIELRPGRSNDKFAGPGLPATAVPVGPSPNNLGNEDGFAVHVFEV